MHKKINQQQGTFKTESSGFANPCIRFGQRPAASPRAVPCRGGANESRITKMLSLHRLPASSDHTQSDSDFIERVTGCSVFARRVFVACRNRPLPGRARV